MRCQAKHTQCAHLYYETADKLLLCLSLYAHKLGTQGCRTERSRWRDNATAIAGKHEKNVLNSITVSDITLRA